RVSVEVEDPLELVPPAQADEAGDALRRRVEVRERQDEDQGVLEVTEVGVDRGQRGVGPATVERQRAVQQPSQTRELGRLLLAVGLLARRERRLRAVPEVTVHPAQ